MKKSLLTVLSIVSVLACAPSLSSCGGAKPNFQIPEGGFDTTKEVTINFYTTQGDALKTITTNFLKEFNKIYPNIHVEMPLDSIGYDALRDQIKTEISINKGPDVAYCYPDHVALYNKKQIVVSMDALINDKTTDDQGKLLYGLTEDQINDFIPGFYAEGRQFGDGLMYTLPWSKSTECIYYDKDFFEAHNLHVPTKWFGENDEDSMEYVCKKIKELDPNSIPLGYDSEANWFITMCEQYGSGYTSATGNHYKFENRTNKDFVAKFKDWYDKGYVTTQQLCGGYTSNLFVSTDPVRSYMSIGSTGGANHQVPADINNKLPFHVGVAMIPQINPAKPKVISQGPSVCILNQGDPQKVMAAWLFVRYFTTSAAFQANFSIESGYMPVIKSVNTIPAYNTYLESAEVATTKQAAEKKRVTAAVVKLGTENTNAYYTSPAFYGSSTARDEVGNLLAAAMSGSKTIDQAFADAISECEYKS